MSALPTKTDLNGTPTTGEFKAAIGAVHDYLSGLLGSDGGPATALATMRLLAPDAIYNLSLVPSVGSNALTMTVKSRDGTTALSSSEPGFVSQRDATLGNGLFNLRQITANIALTVSAGSTLGHASAQPGWLYWYLIDNAGTQELAVSMRDFGVSGIVSTSAEGGAGGADSGAVMYSASARSNVPFRLIGRTQDTQATAGNWVNLPATVELPPFTRTDRRPGTMLMWPQMEPPSWALVRDGAAISRATYPELFAALCPLRTGALTSASASVTGLSSTRDLWVGMPVEASGIPAGTTIDSIDSASAITLSQAATATGMQMLTLFVYGYGLAGSSSTFGVPDDRELFERGWADTAQGYDETDLTGTTTSSSAVVTGLSSTAGLYVGQALSAASGIPGSTTIASIDSATQITMSANATASGSRTITFAGRSFGAQQGDELRAHSHRIRAIDASGGTTTSVLRSTSSTAYVDIDTIESSGGQETRPRNRAYLPIIIY